MKIYFRLRTSVIGGWVVPVILCVDYMDSQNGFVQNYRLIH